MGGWIALPRDIENHWLWNNPRKFQMWIKMVFMAQWTASVYYVGQQSIKVNRGQFVTTLRAICAQLGCCKEAALKFLKALEDSKMIRKDVYSKYTLITILNYDNFQPEKGDEISSEIISETVSKTQDLDTMTDRKTDRKTDHIITNNNKKINNSSSSSSREKFSEIFEKFKTDENLWRDLEKLLGRTQGEIMEGCEKFFSERKAKNDVPPDEEKLRVHLVNWLRRNLEKNKPGVKRNQKTETKNATDKEYHRIEDGKEYRTPNKYDPRRGVDAATPTREELSKAEF